MGLWLNGGSDQFLFFSVVPKFIELICFLVFVWTLCGSEVEFQMKLVSVHVLNFFSIFLLVITTTEQLFTWRPWEAPKDAWNAFWNTIPKVSISWTRTRWAYMEYNIVACEIGAKSAVIKWSFEYQDSDPNENKMFSLKSISLIAHQVQKPTTFTVADLAKAKRIRRGFFVCFFLLCADSYKDWLIKKQCIQFITADSLGFTRISPSSELDFLYLFAPPIKPFSKFSENGQF